MATITVYDLDMNPAGQLELDDEIFNTPVREHLFWEVVRMQLANRRQGTRSTKDRSQVSYSTKKQFRQKGTGNARKGSRKAAGLVGGGTVFGPKPNDFGYRVPKKMRKAALRAAISSRFQGGRLLVLDNFELPQVKTKGLAEVLKKLDLTSGLLVDQTNANLDLSSRNLSTFKYLAQEGLNVYDILRYDTLVLTKAAVAHVQGALKR